jgi:hypothetical protein
MTASLEDKVSSYSRPTSLKITDLRIANLKGVPFRSSIIRIDTNEGISGYGEVPGTRQSRCDGTCMTGADGPGFWGFRDCDIRYLA